MKYQNKPIRILNIVPNMRAAGIETFIMNVYRNIDRSKIQFDFLVHNKKREFYDDEIEELGGKIFRLSFKDDKNIFKYIKDLNTFFKEHKEYKIVHGHMQSMMPLYLMIAKINNIKVRIAHSHNGSYEKSIKGFILYIFSRFSKYFSSENWACSKLAGNYLFGKSNFKVIYNGIDTKKFDYNEKIRINMRKNLKLSDKLVILHVGRFEKQKNHKFIIDWYKNFLSKNKNSVLLLAGEGKLENKIKKYAYKKGVYDDIRFLGVRKDIDKLMQVADYFVLPSLYEGLPVVGIEAQYCKLECLFSNKITNEILVNDHSKFLSINNNSYVYWTNMILNGYERKNVNIIDKKKFDIKNISKNILKEYERLANEEIF